MVFGAVLAVMLYYPLSSFIYPNLQFADKTLDLKYKPTFVIILAQGKLVIIGIAVFFPGVGNGFLLLVCALPMYVLFAALNHTMQPCLVQWVNDGRTFLYCGAVWCVAVSFLVLGGVNKTACWAILGVGTAGMAAGSVWRSYIGATRQIQSEISIQVAPAEETLSVVPRQLGPCHE